MNIEEDIWITPLAHKFILQEQPQNDRQVIIPVAHPSIVFSPHPIHKLNGRVRGNTHLSTQLVNIKKLCN